MQRILYVILALSLVANGGMAGLIAGHLLSGQAACRCGEKPERRERGPFPTGWVTPDDAPEPDPIVPKPKPKPDGARP